MLFCAFGLTNSHGVYQDYYVRVHLSNYSPSTIGWIGSFQVFLGASGPLTLYRSKQLVLILYFIRVRRGSHGGNIVRQGVFLSDDFRIFVIVPLFVRWQLPVYDEISSFCKRNFMLSFAQPQKFYQIFLTQGVGVGISLGFLFLPSVSVISHHFERKRALAMGIAASGSSCGGIVFPLLINKMIEKYGFPWATRIAAFVCLGLMSISLACMRTRPPPLRPQVEGAEQPSVLAILKDTPYVLAVLAALANMMGIFFLGKSLLLNY